MQKISKARQEYLKSWYTETTVFKELREEREHMCMNCKWIIKSFDTYIFAHIVHKSISKKHRLNKNNIILVCSINCHNEIDKVFNRERYYLERQLNNGCTYEDIIKEFNLQFRQK